MSGEFDVARQLAAVADRGSAWRFIEGFAAGWLTPLSDGDGFGDGELDAVEQRLGLRLPAAIREAYALFGRRSDLASNQDRLLRPDEICLDAAGEALVFRVENQTVARWGVLTADLDRPDPPVWIRLDMADKRIEKWEAWLGSFSLACVEIVLSESLFSSEVFADNRPLEEGEAALLEQRYVRLALPDYPISQVSVPAVRWFAGPDVVLREDQREWLWARARTTAALAELRRELPGDWMLADEDEGLALS